jgi:hypothetical protein
MSQLWMSAAGVARGTRPWGTQLLTLLLLGSAPEHTWPVKDAPNNVRNVCLQSAVRHDPDSKNLPECIDSRGLLGLQQHR